MQWFLVQGSMTARIQQQKVLRAVGFMLWDFRGFELRVQCFFGSMVLFAVGLDIAVCPSVFLERHCSRYRFRSLVSEC